jgi:hypothetical protein
LKVIKYSDINPPTPAPTPTPIPTPNSTVVWSWIMKKLN